MKHKTISEQDRRRWRAMVAVQIVCYGYLLIMFGIQVHLAVSRNWWGAFQ